VERIPLPASSRHFAAIPLQQPGKVLSGTAKPLWPATVLAACAAANGDMTIGSKVAAAVEIFMAGLDVLDEIEDGDQSPLVDAVGTAQALNIATALLLLPQTLLCGLTDDGVVPARANLLARTLAEAGLAATGGQHRDLLGEQGVVHSYDAAIEIARMKAGTLVAGACKLGALVGTDDDILLAHYHNWGLHYGTAAQLSNDLHDAENGESKSDLARQKGTVPLIYQRGSTPGSPTPNDAQESGALHFTWVILEIERQQCAAIADDLAAHGQAAEHLLALLGSV
jgi:geranylgeranyl pyrophosphate synthase